MSKENFDMNKFQLIVMYIIVALLYVGSFYLGQKALKFLLSLV